MEKNAHLSINPDTITCGSKCVVWWKCSECGWEWEDKIQSRSDGKNALHVVIRRIQEGVNEMFMGRM